MVVANLAPFVSARSPRFGASGVTPGCFLFSVLGSLWFGRCQSRLPSTSRPGKGATGTCGDLPVVVGTGRSCHSAPLLGIALKVDYRTLISKH